MVIAKIITILNLILWLLPPVRQYRGKYFLYFSALAVSDPVMLLLVTLLGVNPLKTYFVISLILLLIIINLSKKISYKKIILLIFIIVVALYFNIKFFALLIAAIHMFIFFYFIVITIQYYYSEEKLILFHFALLFYEMTIVLKFIFILIDLKKGILDFYVTTFMEILFAIYFCWDVEEKPKVVLLKKNILPK